MHKTIILGSILALAGFATLAHASDDVMPRNRDAASVQRLVSDDDSRGDHDDRYERKDRTRERHDESRERHENRGTHDDSDDRRDRR